jgi:hypothetical protein
MNLALGNADSSCVSQRVKPTAKYPVRNYQKQSLFVFNSNGPVGEVGIDGLEKPTQNTEEDPSLLYSNECIAHADGTD